MPVKAVIVSLRKPIDVIFKNIDKRERWAIRKAIRQGIKVEVSKDYQDLQEFQNALLMNKHIKYEGELFYRALYRELITKGLAELFIAKYKGEIIGGSIVLINPQRDVAYYYKAAINPYYKRTQAGSLLIWKIIERYFKQKFLAVDLGHYLKPTELQGVYEFKKKFGNIITAIKYTRSLRLLGKLFLRLSHSGKLQKLAKSAILVLKR